MKTKTALFYAKELPSGYYAIYVNGFSAWIDAARSSVDAVREYIDKIAAASKLNSYTLTFHKEEYEYYLNYYGMKENSN